MTVEGTTYRKRADAGQHLKQIAQREIAELTGLLDRTTVTGELGGLPSTWHSTDPSATRK